VRNPGIYELSAGGHEMSVKQLLSLAGGLEVRGRYRLSILRVQQNGSNAMIGLNGESGVVRDSEILFAEPGAQQTEQGATLSGGTPLAGVFSVGSVTKLSQVLKSPGALGENPYTVFGLVVRRDNTTQMTSLVAFTPAAVINGRDDIDLTGHDVVRVFSAREAALLSAVMNAFLQARNAAVTQALAPQYLQPGASNSQAGTAFAASLLNQQQQALPQQNIDYGNGHAKPPNTEREDLALLSNLVLGDGGVLVPPSGNSNKQQNGGGDNSAQSSSTASSPTVPSTGVPPISQMNVPSLQNSLLGLQPTMGQQMAQPQIIQQPYKPLPPNMEQQTTTSGKFPTNQEVETFGDLASQLGVDPLVLIHFLLDHEVTLNGAVLAPGNYLVGPSATLQELVSAAGGTRGWVDQSGVEIVSTSVDPLRGVSHSERQLLPMQASNMSSYIVHPHDDIRFREIYASVGAGSVTIQGQVRYPGTYSIERGEKLSTLLLRAGGLTDVAYPYGTVFLRQSAADMERAGYQRAAGEVENAFLLGMTRVGDTSGSAPTSPVAFAAVQDFVNQLRATPAVGRISIIADPAMLVANPERDTLLESADVIYIPQRPSTVTVLGQVNQPGSFPFRSNESVADYIDQAGGYGPIADKSLTFIVFPDGTAKPVETSWLSLDSPNIPPGSTIWVARDLAPIDLRQIIIDVSTIFRELALSAASLAVIANKN
jgi:protein involved in polysaccharide export with SLBB domain